MATKRKREIDIPEDQNTNKKLKNQEAAKQEDHNDAQESTKSIDTKIPPHFPDLVIHQILRLVPTKLAIRVSFLSKQWAGVWSSIPVLDFEEFDEPHYDDTNLDKIQHTKFINFIQSCLKFHKNVKLLDKFRLCMTRYFVSDTNKIDECLSFAIGRSVKELDISLPGKPRIEYYCLHQSVLNAESLTFLNLEFVTIRGPTDISLPSLKTMSLKNVKFDSYQLALHNLISGCPSIEHLSLISCSFDNCIPVFEASSSSLKSLEVIHCGGEFIPLSRSWLFLAAKNLESFTFISNHPTMFENMVLNECRNLKYINFRAQYLNSLALLDGCQDSLEATINTPNLLYFMFSWNFNFNVSIKAPNLLVANIQLANWEHTTFNWSWKHFSALRGFLEVNIGCCQNIVFCVPDAKALIFPENFRKTFSPPLPILERVEVIITNTLQTEARDSNLRDSLLWMAPSTDISPIIQHKIL